MDDNEFRSAAHAAIDEIITYFTSLPTVRPLSTVSPGYLRPLLPSSAPTHPEPWSTIQPDISAHILPGITHWQSPNFMAFFPANTSYPSILGEIYSAAFTAPAFNWLCSPACTELETVVCDWVAGMLGLPDTFLGTGTGGGVVQGSASEAIVTVMVAARERVVRRVVEEEGLTMEAGESKARERRREDRQMEVRSGLVALGSEQAHSSTQKAAANVLGVRYRVVPAGKATGFRMTGEALRETLEECRREGLHPFYVTAALGTTGTCAVDDFEEIAKVKRDWPDLWVHVDAAWAGAALVCPEMRDAAGAKWLGEFESFDVNLHKWLLVNFDASILFIRSRHLLTSALSITPAYLQNPASLSATAGGTVTDYRDWQIPLGRRFRALKIWFVLRSYGVAGLQAMVRKHVALGEVFAKLVGERGDLFEVVAGPAYALTVFRCLLPGGVEEGDGGLKGGLGGGERDMDGEDGNRGDEMNGHGAELGHSTTTTTTTNGDGRIKVDALKRSMTMEAENALTKKVYELVNSRGEIFVTSTLLDGVYVIRVVSANEMAEEKYVRRAFEILVEVAEEVRAAAIP